MLPVLTAIDDVKSLIAYLKNKPTGATSAEIKATLGANVVDPRKMATYTTWRLVEKTGERFKLSERGWRLARMPAFER